MGAMGPAAGFAPANDIIAGSFAGPLIELALTSIQAVEDRFQLRMGSAQSVNHIFRPIEILPFAFARPTGRR